MRASVGDVGRSSAAWASLAYPNTYGGGAMAQRKFRTNIVVSLEPDEGGWVRATLPGMPSVVTGGGPAKMHSRWPSTR